MQGICVEIWYNSHLHGCDKSWKFRVWCIMHGVKTKLYVCQLMCYWRLKFSWYTEIYFQESILSMWPTILYGHSRHKDKWQILHVGRVSDTTRLHDKSVRAALVRYIFICKTFFRHCITSLSKFTLWERVRNLSQMFCHKCSQIGPFVK